MRHVLQRSADAWTTRAALLARLEREFDARAGSFEGKRHGGRPEGQTMDNGQVRSTKEAQKRTAKGAKMTNVANPSRKGIVRDLDAN
jgi:hypothetical protein